MECEQKKDSSSWKMCFVEKVLKLEKKEDHYNVMTKSVYDKLIEEVEEAKTAAKKSPRQYRRLKRFNVLKIGKSKTLVSNGTTVKHYLPVDEVFDVLEFAHNALGHGGRDKMKPETSRKYANITTEMINIFLSTCETCKVMKNKKKNFVAKPATNSELNSRCQVDVIDMQSQPDGVFKFILVYQDDITKFIILRALESKTAEEIAYQLTDIFLTFGAPCILHFANCSEFLNSIITNVTNLWPELKILPGKQKNGPSQSSVERAKRDIKNMLSSWVMENQTTNWSNGLRYVQFMKNRAFHSGIKQTPYKALFGFEPRVGLTTSSLPSEVMQSIHDEDDLQQVVEQMQARDKVGGVNEEAL